MSCDIIMSMLVIKKLKYGCLFFVLVLFPIVVVK